MILTLGIITTLLLITCGYSWYKYFILSSSLLARSKKYVDDLYNNHRSAKNDIAKRLLEVERLEKKLNTEHAKQKDILSKKEKELEAKYNTKVFELSNEYSNKKKELEDELDAAMDDAESALRENIKKVDNLLEERIADITAKNTRMFTCACNDKLIPCFIDLTKENTYRCDECGTVYSVEVRMNPVIIGKAISDEDYIAIINSRLEDERR